MMNPMLFVARRFESKRIPFEMALIKLSHRADTQSLAEPVEKIEALE